MCSCSTSSFNSLLQKLSVILISVTIITILLYCRNLYDTQALENLSDINTSIVNANKSNSPLVINENVNQSFSKNNTIHLANISNETEYRYPLTIKERVKYYLTSKWYSFFTANNQSNNESYFYVNVSLFNSNILKNSRILAHDSYVLVSEKVLEDYKKRRKKCNLYCRDPYKLLKLPAMKKCKYHNYTNRYVMQFWDASLNIKDYPTMIPVFKKARFMNEENALLLNLHSRRHFDFYSEIEENDIPWIAKDSKVLWRGSMTGYHGNVRYTVVNKYFKYYAKQNVTNITIDIAFFTKNQNYKMWKKAGMNTDGLLRKKMKIPKMLQSKYLVSIAGNDVSTNLGWILYSNSVPFLFRLPLEDSEYETEAWLMHGLLQPYVHYIPFTVNNDTDESLMKAFEFCESHSENCSQIAQNGKQWMIQFKDEEREEEIQTNMLVLYCNSVHVI